MNNRTRKILEKLKNRDDAVQGSMGLKKIHSVRDKDYMPSPSSSDSDIGYGQERDKVKCFLFKEDDNLITLQDLVEVPENVVNVLPASSNSHLGDSTHDQVEYHSVELQIVFEALCQKLRHKTLLKRTTEIPLKVKVLCALSFLATGSYQRIVGVTQHLAQRTASRCIKQVVDALNHPAVMAKWIEFPKTRQDRAFIKQEFVIVICVF
ncbi:unnamed protein product [Arctia plantaginis]|uniref:Nuclease HARBI1 n=1 Tax=Arctia plantaginis TaxID=874455 RepID=A0A8S1ARD8_ARCPL|nr:unnamed protein product [Arctia plantaginis]